MVVLVVVLLLLCLLGLVPELLGLQVQAAAAPSALSTGAAVAEWVLLSGLILLGWLDLLTERS
jgi:hypothetical protein